MRIVSQTADRMVTEEDVLSRYGGTYPRRTVSIKCCGEWIECRAFTNTCSVCGADFNMSGQRLAPRSQWGEETGEHWTDCI